MIIVLTIAFTTTGICQDISTEEINRQVAKDSATFSWEQANQFVNGLENERKLDSAYHKLIRENMSLLGAYKSLEDRLSNYKVTIVPSLKENLKIEKKENENLLNVLDSSEKMLGKQRRKKWIWGGTGIVIGTIIGLVLAVTI